MMAVEGQLASLSPYESLRHVQALLGRGTTWAREVLLCVTTSTLTVRDGSTKVSFIYIYMVGIPQHQLRKEDPRT